MKNVCLFAAIALFSVISVQAQNPTDLIQFGVKGGVNFSSVVGDDFESPDTRTSFNAGVLVEIPYSDRFSVQGEVLYSAQGFAVSEQGSVLGVPYDYDAEYQLGYIQVPILAKVYLVDGLNVQVGPQVGFLINEEVDYQPTNDAGDVPVSEENSALNDINFGIAAGLEYKFDNGFFVQGRYNYGITKLVEDGNAHNSVIQAGVGFMF